MNIVEGTFMSNKGSSEIQPVKFSAAIKTLTSLEKFVIDS